MIVDTENCILAINLAKKLGFSKMTISKLKKDKVITPFIIDSREFYLKKESILIIREKYKHLYMQPSVHN